jgi:hypothetical protein
MKFAFRLDLAAVLAGLFHRLIPSLSMKSVG